MITETLLAAALLYTGGAAINDNPQNVYEGISGCAAYEQALEQRACVGRVHFQWTGERVDMEAAEAPVSAYRAPSAPQVPTVAIKSSQTPQEVAPGMAKAIDTGEPVPVVEGNATIVDGEWVAPEWCEFTKDYESYDGPIEHASGDDWSIVTESWEDHQVELCF